MIKLIASDMDGTLLTPEGKIPKEFFDVYKKLKEKNIEFVVASGRPYKTLYENFKPISDDISYISDNGAMVVENGQVVSTDVISKDLVKKAIDVCKRINNIGVIFCGVKNFYHLKYEGDLLNEIEKYYIHKNIIDSFEDIDDDIFKISICDMNNALENSYPILEKELSSSLQVVVAGKYWTDLTNLGVNKGSAIEKIQLKNSITPKETMVFGDYFNDVEMLKKAYYSYVMEDALDEMKKHGNFIAESNSNNGVIKAIEKVALKG